METAALGGVLVDVERIEVSTLSKGEDAVSIHHQKFSTIVFSDSSQVSWDDTPRIATLPNIAKDSGLGVETTETSALHTSSPEFFGSFSSKDSFFTAVSDPFSDFTANVFLGIDVVVILSTGDGKVVVTDFDKAIRVIK